MVELVSLLELGLVVHVEDWEVAEELGMVQELDLVLGLGRAEQKPDLEHNSRTYNFNYSLCFLLKRKWRGNIYIFALKIPECSELL